MTYSDSAYIIVKYGKGNDKPENLVLCIKNSKLYTNLCKEIESLGYKYEGSVIGDKGINHSYSGKYKISISENTNDTFTFTIVGSSNGMEATKVSSSETNNDVNSSEEDPISYSEVQVKPSFMGGDANAFSNWVNSRLVYPEIARDNGVQGRVVLRFTIDTDGSIKNVRVARGIDPALDKEAVRVVSSSPKWTPGQADGQLVKVNYSFSVIFQLR